MVATGLLVEQVFDPLPAPGEGAAGNPQGQTFSAAPRCVQSRPARNALGH